MFGPHKLPSQYPLNIDKCQSQQREDVEQWMVALTNSRQRQAEFDAAIMQEEQCIMEAFRRVQTIVDRIQGRVIAEFNGKVDVIRKTFATELVSIEVLANQAAAGVRTVVHELPNSLTEDAGTIIPRFAHVPFANVEAILGGCWSIVTKDQLSEQWSVDTVNVKKAQAVVKNVSEIGGIVKTALKTAYANEYERRIACWQRSQTACCPWQGELSGAYEIDFSIAGLAVNKDASLFAVSDYSGNSVSVFKLPMGETLEKFGEKGSGFGQFDGPLRLCFTLHDTLLVADSNNKRVQEVTFAGNHVRFVQSDEITETVLHVTCNADVIVLTQRTIKSWLCVFEMRTGSFLRSFGASGSGPGKLSKFWDTTLTFDGTALLIADSVVKRISVISLDGTFLRTIGDVSTLELMRGVAELPDGRVVVTEAGNPQLAIVENKDDSLTFVDTKVRSMIGGACLIRFSNGYVFHASGNFVHVFRF